MREERRYYVVLVRMFGELLTIKDDDDDPIPPTSNEESDDLAVCREKYENLELTQSNWQKSLEGSNLMFHKPIQRQLKKRKAAGQRKKKLKIDDRSMEHDREPPFSARKAAVKRKSDRKQRTSKERSATPCSTWRQLTIRSVTEGESTPPSESWRFGSKSGSSAVKETNSQCETDSGGEMMGDCLRKNITSLNRKNLVSHHKDDNEASQTSSLHKRQTEKNTSSLEFSQGRQTSLDHPHLQPRVVLIDVVKNSPSSSSNKRVSKCTSDYDVLAAGGDGSHQLRSKKQSWPQAVPTWRQLTKQHHLEPVCLGITARRASATSLSDTGGSSDKITKKSQAGKSHDECELKNSGSTLSRNRRHSEGTPHRRKTTRQSDPNPGSRSSAKKPRRSSSMETSPRPQIDKVKSKIVVLPTWRQLSILKSDHSLAPRVSVKSHETPKKSGCDAHLMEPAVQALKTMPIAITPAHLKMPTIRIPRSDTYGHQIADETDYHRSCSEQREPSMSSQNDPAARISLMTMADSTNPPDCSERHPEIIITGELGEKPHYKCSMCDFTCNQLGMITTHTDTHDSGARPYACDECDYKAKTEQLLTSHMITHAGEKPYPCNLCDQRFRTKTFLSIHVTLNHEETIIP